MSILHVAFYPSDWLAGTRGLSDGETGVYITLIARMYEMAGPIERDDNRLSRLCGCKSKNSFVKALEYLISEGKIIEDGSGLFNERVQKEIQNTTKKSDKAAAAAKARWDKKPNKNNKGDNANASPKHMPQRCQLEPEPDSIDLGKPKSCSFSDFWKGWPNKVGKVSAQKAWGRLSQQDRQAAHDSTTTWFDRWKAANPTASPIHASTYLNKKRWQDEFAPTLRAVGGSDVDRDEAAVQAIKTGKHFLCTDIPKSRAERLVHEGRVTLEEIKTVRIV